MEGEPVTTQTYVAGSVEYLTVTVTADVALTDQTVALSLDRGTTWLPCAWIGDEGTSRQARTTDPHMFTAGTVSVLVKVADTPEVPIIKAGQISVTR